MERATWGRVVRRSRARRGAATARVVHAGVRAHLRIEASATIDEPLPTRTQTILSYRVPEDVRQAINGDVTDAMPASRKHGFVLDLKL